MSGAGALRRRLALGAAGFLLTGLVLELLLRSVMGNVAVAGLYQVAPPDGRCVALRPGAEVSYTGLWLKIPPVTLEVNELGYRGPPIAAGPKGASQRVAVFGDSMIYGQGVAWNETIPHFLGEALAQSRGVPAPVLNFGVPGLGAEDFRDHFTRFVGAWHPGLLILALIENDLEGSICDVVPRTRAEQWLFRASYLFRLLKVIKSIATSLVTRALFVDAERLERDAARLEEILEGLRGDVRAAGGRLAVVVLADPITLRGGEGGELLDGVLERLGVPWLDLRGQEFPRIRGDGHFTEHGNRDVAGRVAAWLAIEGIRGAPARPR